ncbi:MAG: hypothetical protein IT291_08460 [Deltaproteobacteria bacterium]|nr:hypothetical protein [Deltaproteobacteria bacterium]
MSVGMMPGMDAPPVLMLVVFVGMAIVPFLLLSCTSYLKLSVVFAILRNALGAQQVPSGVVVSILSLVLTVHIMSPVAMEVSKALEDSAAQLGISTAGKAETKEAKPIGELLNALKANDIIALAKAASEPVSKFLRQNSGVRERMFFSSLSSRSGKTTSLVNSKDAINVDTNCAPTGGDEANAAEKCAVNEETFLNLVSSFVISELQEAFAIGFAIVLPFLIVDIVIANLLIGLGMMMVSPVTISFPFKVILFVLCDGWYLLCKGLILGYGVAEL